MKVCQMFLNKIRIYFSELIKPLATNMSLNEMFDKMKEVISKFESKISELNDKIYELESQIAIQEETIKNLLTKCDDHEHYSHRSCLRIHDIESNSNGKNGNVIEKIRECYNALALPLMKKLLIVYIELAKSIRTKSKKRRLNQKRRLNKKKKV